MGILLCPLLRRCDRAAHARQLPANPNRSLRSPNPARYCARRPRSIFDALRSHPASRKYRTANGLRYQLPSYLTSDNATHGWFISVQYRCNKSATDRLTLLPAEVSLASDKINKHIRYAAVDARRPISASNIERAEDV